MCPVAGDVVGVAYITKKCRNGRVGPKSDRTAGSPIAPTGLALWLSLRPYERDNPRTAIAGAKADTNPVNKHDRWNLVGGT